MIAIDILEKLNVPTCSERLANLRDFKGNCFS